MKNDIAPWLDCTINSKLSRRKLFFKYISVAIFLILGVSLKAQTSYLNTLISKNYFTEDLSFKVDSFIQSLDTISMDSLADCHHDIGRRLFFVQWRRTGNTEYLDEAIRYTNKAVELKLKISPQDSASVQKSLLNLASFQRYGQYIGGSIQSFEQLIEHNLVNRKYFIACRQLAECYALNGDFYIAKSIIEKGIEKNKNIDVEQLALSHYTLAEILSRLGFESHNEAILKNLNIARSYNDLAQSSPKKKKQLRKLIEHLNGNRLLKTNNYEEAVVVLKQNISEIDARDSTSLAIAYNSLGYSNLKLADYSNAFTHLNEALKFNPNYSPPLENLGDYFLERKEYKTALDYYQQAILTNANLNDSMDLNVLPSISQLSNSSNKTFLLNHLVQKAKAQIAIHNDIGEEKQLLLALETLKLADGIIDELKFLSLEEQSKFFWVENAADLYMSAVEVCYQLNRPKEAFYFIEKNKSILLLGELTQDIAKQEAKLPTGVIQKLLELERKERTLESDLAITKINNKQEIKDALYSLKRDRVNFSDSIDVIYPTFGKAKRKLEIIAHEKFVSQYIQPDNFVVQYILNDERGFGLIHFDQEIVLFEIEPNTDLAAKINTLYEELSSPVFTNDGMQQIDANSNALFKSLFPEEVRGKIHNRKLLIVCDGLLQKIPFEILNKTQNGREYLIESCEIQYAYSISHLDLNEKIERKASENFLGISPVDFAHNTLAALPYSEQEINEIKEIASGEVLLKGDATVDNFLKKCNQFKILHFSTHADGGEGKLPWLAFKDDKMYLKELYNVNVQSEMVVLSSCNSSSGEIKKGEGVISLARSFFYAGANSIVASLWTANDKSNKTIMQSYYLNLKKGEDKSEALRNAKLEYINSHSGSELSPYYWASNILIGNSKVIEFKERNFSTLLLGAFLVLGIIFFIWFRKSKP